jgi:hypothetical protein
MSIQTKTVAGGTATPVVDHQRFWQPMETCPLGVKVNLLNPFGVAVSPGAITGKTRHSFAGWEPLAKIPKEWKI